MSENLKIIEKKFGHLAQMRLDLEYSIGKMALPLEKIEKKAIASLTPDERETVSAFTARFSDFQEHLAKTMRGIAIEEEVNVDLFGNVLAFMEKLQILDNIELWKAIRELRNSVNHEYEDDPEVLFQFLNNLIKNAPFLFSVHNKLKALVKESYGFLFDDKKATSSFQLK
jgi:hypothetical protein